MTKTGWAATILASAIAGLVAFLLTAPPRGPRSLRDFEPSRIAELERARWEADDARARVRLFTLLITTVREQYHTSWTAATVQAFHLARAATRFADLADPAPDPGGDRAARGVGGLDQRYDRVVVELEKAYGLMAEWHQARFDPRAVARAELAWWVARRTPGQNDPAQVAALMAEAYALLYDTPAADVLPAALLRAEAAALRDRPADAPHPDWTAIEALLNDSYRVLRLHLSSSFAD